MEEFSLPNGLKRYVNEQAVYNNDGFVIGESIHLYQTPTRIFEIVSGREGKYLGCGIDSAQSLLRWFGLIYTQLELTRYIQTGSVVGFKSIYTLPSWLYNGINNIIETSGIHMPTLLTTIAHDKNTFLSTVILSLKSASPIIVLVNHGKHWVVIVGVEYQGDNVILRIIDNEYTRFVSWEDLNVLDWGNKLYVKALRWIGFHSYQEGFLLYFSESNPLQNYMRMPSKR